MCGFARDVAVRLVLITLGASAIVAISAEGAAQINSASRAQALVEAMFPDLRGQGLRVRASGIVGFDGPWQSANPLQLTVEKPGASGSAQPLLRAHIRYNRGDYDYASFEGQLIAEESLARVVALNRRATEWSLDDVSSALASENAKYGPGAGAAFERLISLDRWASAFGRVTLADVRFVWQLPFEDVGAKDRITTPVWVVDLLGTSDDGSPRCYGLTFEPINGRPIAVRAAEC